MYGEEYCDLHALSTNHVLKIDNCVHVHNEDTSLLNNANGAKRQNVYFNFVQVYVLESRHKLIKSKSSIACETRYLHWIGME